MRTPENVIEESPECDPSTSVRAGKCGEACFGCYMSRAQKALDRGDLFVSSVAIFRLLQILPDQLKIRENESSGCSASELEMYSLAIREHTRSIVMECVQKYVHLATRLAL